jgi:hypothetical protein
MSGNFGERMSELSRIVGSGDLVGSVVVDQVYAQRQHEDLNLNHPQGGQAKYLSQPLMDSRDDYLKRVARTVLEDGGTGGMRSAMEDLAGEGGVAKRAPLLWGDLRRSGHPSVTSDGSTVYDRAPLARRLSEEELRAKARLIPLPGPLLGYIWHHVEHHTGAPPRHPGGA